MVGTARTIPSVMSGLRARSRVRARVALTFLVVAGLCVVGVVVVTSVARRSGAGSRGASPLACPFARATPAVLVTIPAGLGHGGFVLRTAVSSPTPCTMSGYPALAVDLSNHVTVRARDMRLGYLGGYSGRGRLARLAITPRARIVSFTIQEAACDGPRPTQTVVRITLPGSPVTLVARSFDEAPFGTIRGFGMFCGDLRVTPLVAGASGSGHRAG